MAEARFRKLDSPHLLAEVAGGVTFIDGERARKRENRKRLAA